MKTSFNIRTISIISSLLFLMGVAPACNKESSSKEEEEVAVTSSTVAVNSFKLKANKDVAASLDSVFFSIDLNNAVIFNADSLPKGADVSKLVPVITFAGTMSKAQIAVLGEQGDTIKKVNYLTTTTDSIDFTKRVVLDVTSNDGLNSLQYRLKVNVHKLDPDSIGWEHIQVAPLPSRLDAPQAAKTVLKGDTPYSLVKEQDGSYSLTEASDIFSNQWTASPLSLPFNPVVESFTASDNLFYILDEVGNLYSSADGTAWENKASGWQSIIGCYGADTLLGIKNETDGLHHVVLTAGSENVGSTIPGDFPISGRSSFVTISNRWAEEPTGFFVGGLIQNGTLSDSTWGFDGQNWAVLSNSIPALESASLVKYTMYRNTSSSSKIRDYDAWLLIGGALADGSMNRTVYTSFDNGVTWRSANSAMNLPSQFPDLIGMDAFVVNKTLDYDLADGWTSVVSRATRASYTIDGTVISWDCPYIFLSGGYTPDSSFSPEIWRGVLMRLNFSPII